jgi:Galactose oxidase, central domain/Kelch motif
MKKSLLFLISIGSLFLQCACGGGSPPPPPIGVQMSPASLALDVNQSSSVTATVSNAPTTQGFDWSLACGVGSCGSITPHTASGAPATFTAPAAPPSMVVTVTAKLTGVANTGTTTVTVSTPPTVVTTTSPTTANVGQPYSFQLVASGGAAPLTWALSSGSSLPDTLSLNNAGMITGTPSGAGGAFTFTVHATDSANPPQTSPDATLKITVVVPALSISLSQGSSYLVLNATTQFAARVSNDPQNGNVDWTLALNGGPCAPSECGTISPASTPSGAPATYTAPASLPPGPITVTATTVDGNPPAAQSGTMNIGTRQFVPTGSMSTARGFHTATLLGDGTVLVTGGDTNNAPASIATAELFDPTAGSFASTGSMAGIRSSHTATMLMNGKVLITGGRGDGGNAVATTELYDPSTKTFAPAGNMAVPRTGHTATLLNDGTVLITGGDTGNSGTAITATGELFDPSSGHFTTVGLMNTPRELQTATLLQNGKTLITGGQDNTGLILATAELFDPATKAFTSVSTMDVTRKNHTATMLSDGRVLIAGGDTSSESLASTELFDSNTNSFTDSGTMADARAGHRATLLSDGTVLFTAGFRLLPLPHWPGRTYALTINSAELFDPTKGTFSSAGNMSASCSGHTATLLASGNMLVAGGIAERLNGSNPETTVLSGAELFK